MSTLQSMAQMAMGFLCETNDHPANDHPNNDHPTNDHPTNDHPTNDHPTNDHPTNDHPTNDHPSRRDIVTERSEEDWLVILMEQLVTAETEAYKLRSPGNTDLMDKIGLARQMVVNSYPEATDLLGQFQIKPEDSNFFIAGHQSGAHLPDILQSFAKLPTFQGQGYASPIKFDPNKVETHIHLFNFEDDTQLSYETQTDILSQSQGEGEGEVLAFAKSIELKKRSKFQWPRFSYHDCRPTIEEAHEAIEALIAQAHRNITATSFSSGASVSLHNPILQHPGKRLDELSQQPEFPDYTQVYLHIVDKNGVTPFHTEDNGLRSFNLCHIGYKAWIIIPDSSRNSFEEYILRKIGLPTNQLSEAGIEYRVIVQGPGEYVTITSSEYHMVIGLTSSLATSHNLLYPDDPDIMIALEDAKLCEECNNHPVVRDYNANHSPKIGSRAVPTVQTLLQQLAQQKRECNINSNDNGSGNQRHGEQNNSSGDNATTRTNNGDKRKRTALPAETNSAKRKKPPPRSAPAVASKAAEQSHTTVTASSSLQTLPRPEIRHRTKEPAEPAQRMSRRDAVVLRAPTPTSVSADLPEEPAVRERESQSLSPGTNHKSVNNNKDSATAPNTTVSSLLPSTRHENLSQFDTFYMSNPLCRDQLVALPAHNRCGLAAILHTRQALVDFLAAVKGHQNDISNGGGVSKLEKDLSSSNDSEDPATCAMRNAILEMVKSDRHIISKQRSDYRQRFFCYLAHRLWKDAGIEKAQGDGQIRHDTVVRKRLIQQLLSSESGQQDAAVVSKYINKVLRQGAQWVSVATGIGIGMGVIALIPYRNKRVHALNVTAGYYCNGLGSKQSSATRLQEFQSALDTPYMKTLLTAADSLANAIVQKKDIRFQFDDYHGDEPISSLPEADICRLLVTVPSVDPGAGTD
ncbi:hypothetical protein FPOAC1_003651 [Fusarium poae]|uniref:hypothetical protein n=1 Tax=Fusarium poae TaxID=36050 RepID=UPI001CE97616|nr:hypothetical protein FPOAC1_003651 [Fusarium poae]KAG8677627.1 hypothetical protein FPOAC1_003651 [Fusarium poae]